MLRSHKVSFISSKVTLASIDLTLINTKTMRRNSKVTLKNLLVRGYPIPPWGKRYKKTPVNDESSK